MAPIKFEEQLKDKLEKRSLEPSANSWTTLSERLEANEKRALKPWLGWISVAAGIIILLAITLQTFKSEDTQSITPGVVEKDSINNGINNNRLISNKTESQELVIEDKAIKNTTKHVETNNVPNNTKDKPIAEKLPKTELAEHTTTDASKLQEGINATDNSKEAVENEVQINKDAVAQALHELKAQETIVTDREVDSLLKLASKELVRDKLLKETTKTVDAQSLLQDVEDDMGQSFRTKVYEALKEGYKTVKTAVAQRNN